MSRRRKHTPAGDVRIVNLATYTSPDIQVKTNKDYVTYGDKNSYFRYLIDRFTGSPTNNAIINGISQMIFGKGIDATDSNKKPEDYARAVSLLKDSVVRKLAYDLKLMGQCAIQVIYSKDRKTIAQVEHLPVETLAMEKCDEDGEINNFYYCNDWEKVKPNTELQKIPAFGTSNESIEILYVNPYVAGHYYYSPVDYQGGLQYAELEEEISNYHLSNIQNGLAPSMMINFNNGIPDDETRDLIESKIKQKFTGSSNAGRFILNFSDSKENGSDIQTVQLSDAHNQYQFLSDETMRKIMVAHRIVSPMLLGIKDGTGLGNNADELKQASILMDNIVVRPFQNLLIDAFDKILAFNEISLNLYFKTIQPLEFTDLENAMDEETVEEETGIKENNVPMDEEIEQVEASYNGAQIASAIGIVEKVKEGILSEEQAVVFLIQFLQLPENVAREFFSNKSNLFSEMLKAKKKNVKDEFSDEEGAEMLDYLHGEEIDDEWEEVDAREASDENTTDEEWATEMIKPKENLAQKLAKAITSKPSGFSYLDKSYYKIRYRYAEKYSSKDSREFCKTMMKRADGGVVYRLEDIDKASRDGVNKSHGHKGEPYDLFKYKGGVRCGHVWEQVLYRLKKKTDGTFRDKSDRIGQYEEKDSIPKTYIKKPRGTKESEIAPKDMKNEGHHPNYGK